MTSPPSNGTMSLENSIFLQLYNNCIYVHRKPNIFCYILACDLCLIIIYFYFLFDHVYYYFISLQRTAALKSFSLNSFILEWFKYLIRIIRGLFIPSTHGRVNKVKNGSRLNVPGGMGGGWDIDWDVRQSVAATIPYNINIMYTLKAF